MDLPVELLWHGAFPFTEIKVPVLLRVPTAIKETALSPSIWVNRFSIRLSFEIYLMAF